MSQPQESFAPPHVILCRMKTKTQKLQKLNNLYLALFTASNTLANKLELAAIIIHELFPRLNLFLS